MRCPKAMQAISFRSPWVFAGTFVLMLSALSVGAALWGIRHLPDPLLPQGPALRTTSPLGLAQVAQGAVSVSKLEVPESYLPAEVAKATDVEWKLIGMHHGRSRVYESFQNYAKHAPDAELLRLLHHPNPVVRIYVSRHVAKTLFHQAAALYPLLSDDKGASEFHYDMGMPIVVRDAVTLALCEQSDKAQVQSVLLRATEDVSLLPKVRGSALVCVAKRRPQEGERLTSRFLQDPDLRAFGVEALGQLDTEQSLAQLGTYVRDPQSGIRTAVAMGLAGSQRPAALSLLHELLRDSDNGGRWATALVYVRHPSVQPAQLAKLLADPEPFIQEQASRALASRPSPENLKRLRPYLIQRHALDDAGWVLADLLRHKSSRVRAFARSVVAQLDPDRQRRVRMKLQISEQMEREARD